MTPAAAYILGALYWAEVLGIIEAGIRACIANYQFHVFLSDKASESFN